MPRLICDPFNYFLHSIRSSPRDLNLSCWEVRFPCTKTYQCCLRANFESNDSHEPTPSCWKTYGLPDATISTASLHPSERNDCPRSSEISAWALSTTAEILAVRSFEWLFLAGILEPSIRLFKSCIFCHNVINGWSRVFKEPNYFRCWVPSAKAFRNRGYSIYYTPHTWFQYHFENMTVY